MKEKDTYRLPLRMRSGCRALDGRIRREVKIGDGVCNDHGRAIE
jgi:hypothetical protein